MRAVIRAAGAVALLSCIVAVQTPALATTPDPERTRRVSRSARHQPDERSQVTLALTKVTPKTAKDKGRDAKVTLAGTVTNRSGQPLTGLSVRLRYRGSPVTSRDELNQLASARPGTFQGFGSHQPLTKAAAVNGTENWQVSIDTAVMGLRLRGFGVYPVGAEVVTAAGQVLDDVTTFITYVPDKTKIQKTSIAWVWPLIDRQHRTNDQTFIDDQLTTDMSPGGRLSGLVNAAATTTTPLTWAIDPALMDDVDTMSKDSYMVRPPQTRKGQRKPKSTTAPIWLDALRRASEKDPYFTVPYADPDVMALVRNKNYGQLGLAYNNSGVAEQVLGRQGNKREIAWPPAGVAGPQTLNQLAERGRLGKSGSFLLTDRLFAPPATSAPSGVTTRVATERGSHRAITYDAKLSQIVSGNSRTPGAAALAEQRFLAETTLINAENPATSRTVVVAPDRHWNPSPAFAKALLTYSAKAPWMRSIPLDQAAAAAPQERELRGIAGAGDDELGGAYLDEVQEISSDAAKFSSIMVEPYNIKYQRAVLRMESAAWRRRSARAVQAREELEAQLRTDMRSVRVITRRAALGGGSGQTLATVTNELRNQTVKVRVVVSSRSSALKVGELVESQQEFELGPGKRVTLRIPVEASGNGNFPLEVQLRNSEDEDYGDGQIITVRTTGYARMASLIIGGALAVIFVGVGVRAMRARRRRKAEAAGDGSEPATAGALASAEPDAWVAESFPSAAEAAGPYSPGATAPASAAPDTTSARSAGAYAETGPAASAQTGPAPAEAAGPAPAASSGPATSRPAATGPSTAGPSAAEPRAAQTTGPFAAPVPEAPAPAEPADPWAPSDDGQSSGGRHHRD